MQDFCLLQLGMLIEAIILLTARTLQEQVRQTGMVSTLAGRRRVFAELLKQGSHRDFHDELVYEVPEGCVSKVASLLKNLMENAWRLRVPTPVDIKCGPDWGHLEKCKS
eukprot:1145772-Pelagomonas_calceolata.AAC.5